MKKICLAVLMMGNALVPYAQSTNDVDKRAIVVNGDGLKITTITEETEVEKKKSRVQMRYGMLDLGFTFIQDQTNYASSETQAFLNVPANYKNASLFSMQTGKSINVNIWPVLVKGKLYDGARQKIYLNSGIGLQIYNLRFNKNVMFSNDARPQVSLDENLHMKKNKLAIMYTSIPLMVNFKTKMSDKLWLTYGVGITAGVNVDTWTKQISRENGKDKNHDMFNTNPFQLSLTGEIGIAKYIRFYGSYQLTNLYKDALQQQPFVFGIRFLGL